MSRPGPVPVPTAIKRARGNPGKRALNDREPEPQRGEPGAPKHLSAAELQWWRVLIPVLDSMGVLTMADQVVVAALCTHLAILESVKAEYVKLPALMVKEPGTDRTIKNPFLALVNEQTIIINTLCREVGLTPSARSRLSVADKKQKIDTLDEAIFG